MYSQFTRFTTLIVLFVMLVLGAWLIPTSPSLARSTTVNVSTNDSNAAGCDATVDLSGWFTGNNQAKIYNNSTTCSYDVGLASYKKYDEVTDHQTLFDATTDVVAPQQTITLRVSAPQCASQIDAFWGKPLDSLMGARYGKRLLSVRHLGGNNYCSRTCSDGSVTDWVGISSGDVIVGNVDVGVSASGIPAYAIEFKLTGAKAYNHTERVAPYLFTGSTWDTTLVPVGKYRMSATYLASANVRCSTITVDFSIARAPSPTVTPYPTPTSEPTATATATNEPTATATATNEPTVTATATSEPTATATATSEPTATATATSTAPQLRGVLSAVVKLAPRDGRPSAPQSGISGFVRPGDTLQYTIKIDNFGGSAATNVSVQDLLSSATTFTGVSTIAPSSQPGPDQLQWVIGSIAAGSSWEVTFEATVDTDITGVYTLIPNIASVSSDTSWFNTNSLTYLYDPAITP